MAISEQEEFEFRRRAEAERGTAAPQAAPAKKPATFLSTVGRGLYNLPMDTADTLKGAMQQFGPEGVVAKSVAHPIEAVHAAGDFANRAAGILTGGMQHLRDMSSPDAQGDAPRMDTSQYDKFAGDNYDKYGTKQNIYKTVGDHPLGPAIAAASILDPALRVAGIGDTVAGAVPAAVRGAASKIAAPLKTITGAEGRANATTDVMRNATNSGLTDERVAASAEAAAATDRAARASALAERARARGKSLTDRSAAAVADSAPPELAIGEAKHLSDMGDDLRTPAVAQQDTINTDMRAADEKYRTAMEQVASDRAAAGVGVSDNNTAKILIKRSKAAVDPDPVKRPSVGSTPADSAGGKLHNMLLDVLQPKEIPLSVNEAKRARQAGIEVNVAKDGSLSRTIKPDLKTVDDFRRFLGKVLDGKVEGYEAVNRIEAGNMYNGVAKVIDKYVGGASKPVQQNWAAGKRALTPFEKVRAGQAVVGTQAGTEAASVPAANIPGRMLSGGRDTVNQIAAVAGDAPVAATLRSQVQNAFASAKTADAAEALVRPGTRLGDAVNVDPDLSVATRDYIQRLRNAETSGVDAKTLAGRAATNMGRATKLDKAATGAQAKAVAATDSAREYQRELASLGLEEPKGVASKYTAMLNRAHQSGSINTDQYTKGLKLAASAEKDFAIKATRDRWMRRAALTAGVGTASALGADIAHVIGR